MEMSIKQSNIPQAGRVIPNPAPAPSREATLGRGPTESGEDHLTRSDPENTLHEKSINPFGASKLVHRSPPHKEKTQEDESSPRNSDPTAKTKTLVQSTLHKSFFNIRHHSSSMDDTSRSNEYIPTEHSDGKSSEDINSLKDRVEWQKMPELRYSKRKRTVTPSPKKISTSNRFDSLTNEEGSSKDGENDKTVRKEHSTPPPIILYGIEDIGKLTELLATVAHSEDFSFKVITKQQLRLNCTTAETYKEVINLIRIKGLIGHTFTRKEDKLYRIVIKNLHPSTPVDEIKLAIEASGNRVRGEIINARKGPNKIPLPVFFVNLEPSANNKEVKEIKYIFNTKVVIEDPIKKNTIAQCTRCQQYGHTKNNCMRPYRCVKCAEGHRTADCPKKDRNTPAKCALCFSNHPANYKGCLVYKEILARKTKPTGTNRERETRKSNHQTSNKKDETQATTPKSKRSNNSRKTNVSYADVTKGSTEEQPKNLITLLENQTLKMDAIFQQMSTLMELLTTLVNKLLK